MRPALPIFAMVSLAAAAARAEPPSSFDLVCTGELTSAKGESPFSERLSVDLAHMRWCDRTAGCPYVLPVLAERPDDLQLLAVKTPYNEAALDVDLKSGAFIRSTRIPERLDSATTAKGYCTPAAFTAIDAR